MENKKRRFPLVSVIIIIIGFIMVLCGALMLRYGSFAYPSVNTEDIEKSFDARNIENLNLDLAVGSFTIKTGKTDKIEVVGRDIPEDMYRIEISGNTFNILHEDYDFDKNIMFSFGVNYYKNTGFDIIIPEKAYNDVSIDCGVGDLELSGLTTDSFELDFGIGKADMNNCQLGDSDIDIGIGKADFNGKLSGDMYISNGIGSAEFDIDGLKSDYKIEKDGNVDIDYSEVGTENKKRFTIDADSGIGQIKLKFK